jgi:predicted SAM-dependent methyltransferase
MKRFPYADATFDYVFSSHLLEHLYRNQAIFCLNETFRVLKRGVVRIALPDLYRIAQNYDPQHPEYFLGAIFEAKQKYDKNKHHWHYNEIFLTKILKETGFSKTYRCKFREGNCADVTLIDNRPESLFMKAIK